MKFYENLFKTLPTIGNEKRKSKVTPLFSGKIGFINILISLAKTKTETKN